MANATLAAWSAKFLKELSTYNLALKSYDNNLKAFYRSRGGGRSIEPRSERQRRVIPAIDALVATCNTLGDNLASDTPNRATILSSLLVISNQINAGKSPNGPRDQLPNYYVSAVDWYNANIKPLI
jgi:hypothetical protein